jgi:hypothetical protein
MIMPVSEQAVRQVTRGAAIQALSLCAGRGTRLNA